MAGRGRWAVLRELSRARRARALPTDDSAHDRFVSLVQHSSDVITVIDADGIIGFQSPSVRPVFGYEPGSLLGTDIAERVHPDDIDAVERTLGRISTGANAERLECRILHADGSWRSTETAVSNRLSDPAVRGFILNTRDITERIELEQQLAHQAFHDALTGLANRALLRDRIDHALARCRRNGRAVGVLLIDLDGFKTLNDSVGHVFGDALLRSVADRLRAELRASDTACRLGGDEFAVLLEDVAAPADVPFVAQRLLAALRQPYTVDGHATTVTASMGICLVQEPRPGVTADDLLRDADVAMYTAKSRGRDRAELFQPSMHQAMLDRLALEGDLRRAVEAGELTLHYQPTVTLRTGAIAGMEALARWDTPARGSVPPALFIPVAEDTGLIVALGAWVLEEACRQAMTWTAEFGPDAPAAISVNVSARQLQDDAFLEVVERVLRSTGIRPDRVILEITESALMSDAEVMVARLHGLKALGVRLAIDDFGTGYSSMSYLCSFPIDILKIDRSFVTGVPDEPQKRGIVRTIVELGRILDLQTVAEGIELDEELEQLRALDCDLGQGYRFARPLPAALVQELLAGHAAARRRGEFVALSATAS